MTDMTAGDTTSLDPILKRLDLIDERIKALPDKAEIYKATLVIHALVWATIIGTLTLAFSAVRAFNLIG